MSIINREPFSNKTITYVIYMYMMTVHTYITLYNNQINTHALIGQSAMVYCASKFMELLYKSNYIKQYYIKAINHKSLWFIGCYNKVSI